MKYFATIFVMLFFITDVYPQLLLGTNMDETAPLITEETTEVSTTESNTFCRIIPGISANYTIRSIAGIYDTQCFLYDSDGNLIAYNDDYIDLNFLIIYYLNSGETYYLSTSELSYENSTFTLEITGGTLPVELTSFMSMQNEKTVVLNWSTATEVSNYGFDVERSLVTYNPLILDENNPKSKLQNRKWELVGFVPGNGNSNSPKQYTFIDENPPNSNLLYRLKQIDTDGKFEYYSAIAEINFNITSVEEKQLPKENSLEQNYPNPFNPETVISYQLSVSSHATLIIYDILGNEVATLVNEQQQPGYHEVKFSTGSLGSAVNLSSGIYIYKLTAGNYTSTKKLMLMK